MKTGRLAGGSRFPRSDDSVRAASSRGDRPVLTGLNILLVEDEALIAIDVGQLLADTECRVIGPCRDVVDALHAIENEHIDCGILDIRLGAEHSLHLADMLVARNVPFIWMSGYDAQILPAQHRNRPFLCKPFAADELFDALAAALASRV